MTSARFACVLAAFLSTAFGCGGTNPPPGPADAGGTGFVGNWATHVALRLSCPGQADITVNGGPETESLMSGSAPNTLVDLGTTSGCTLTFLITGDGAVLQSGNTCAAESAGAFTMITLSEAVLQLNGDEMTFSAQGTAVLSDAGLDCTFTESGMWNRL